MNALALLVVMCLQDPTSPPRDPLASSLSVGGPGMLRGRVLDAATGQPLRGATVRLWRDDGNEGIATISDAEGRWEIAGLALGEYRPVADKSGYVNGHFRPSRSVVLDEDRPARQLDLKLTRGAVLSGRIVDGFGEPVAGVEVLALRHVPTSSGPRFASLGNGAITDDRGEFRVFGLDVGEYVLAAQRMNRQGLHQGGRGPRLAEVQTYYPGTATVDEAQRFTLGEGTEYNDLTFGLQSRASITVVGKVLTSGERIAHGFVNVSPLGNMAEASHVEFGGQSVKADGSFRIDSLPQGEYRLDVMAETISGEHEVGQIQITAAEEDLEGVIVRTHGPARIRGRLVVEPSGTAPPDGLRIGAYAMVEGVQMTRDEPARVGADGRFEVQAFRSPVRLHALGAFQGWAVKAVRWNGQLVGRGGISFSPGETVTGVELVMRKMTSRITGTVSGIERSLFGGDDDGNEGTVIVFRQTETDELGIGISGTFPIRDGRFSVGPLGAGDYQLVAVRDFDRSLLGQPDRMDALRVQAIDVTVRDDETRHVQLKLVTSY